MSYEDRKKIFDDMKLLQKPEQEEIFRILNKTKESYTENSNGIFFDVCNISNECFNNIKQYLTFCLKIRQEDEIRLKNIKNIQEISLINK